MWVVAYSLEQHGWVVHDLRTDTVVAGPYAEQIDAVQAAQSMAWRITQGWAP